MQVHGLNVSHNQNSKKFGEENNIMRQSFKPQHTGIIILKKSDASRDSCEISHLLLMLLAIIAPLQNKPTSCMNDSQRKAHERWKGMQPAQLLSYSGHQLSTVE